MKKTTGEKVFVAFCYTIMIISGLSCLLPVLNIFAQSLSSVPAVSGGKVLFWPVEFNPEGWKYVIQRTSFFVCMENTVINTVIGTVISVMITILTAYSLSRPYFKGRNVRTYLYVFVMIFSAGTLPHYFQIKSFGLLNTRWSLILPNLISSYYVFVLKKNFEGIPDSLEEAARIDGASFTRILFSVIIPLSKAGIATIIVFTAVAYWNRYFDALLYITRQQLKPASLLLYEIIKLDIQEEGNGEIEMVTKISAEVRNASAVCMFVIPILAIYPFMQKYFVKGTLAGSVKG